MTYQVHSQTPQTHYRLHDGSGRESSLGPIYQRPLSSDTYILPRASARFSAESSYSGGIRSSGMDAQTYLEALSKMRGYAPPERMKGEYKDNDKGGSALNVPSVPLSAMRGLGK